MSIIPYNYGVLFNTTKINLNNELRNNVSFYQNIRTYWKIYDIQQYPIICIKIAQLIKDNQRMMDSDGNYQSYLIKETSYLLPAFNDTIKLNTKLGEINLMTLTYDNCNVNGFMVSVSISHPKEIFNNICKYLETPDEQLNDKILIIDINEQNEQNDSSTNKQYEDNSKCLRCNQLKIFVNIFTWFKTQIV